MLRRHADSLSPELTLTALLIDSPHVPPDTKLMISMTSITNFLLMLEWILENLNLLTKPNHLGVKFFLENILNANDEIAEFTAKHLLGLISFAGTDQYDSKLVAEFIATLNKNDLINDAGASKAYTNAGFFGNHQLIRILLENGLTPPARIFSKSRDDYLSLLEKGKDQKQYLETCKVMIDFKLRQILKEIKSQIKNHRFVLNGGGDNSISEIGHPVTAHAAAVFNLADRALTSKTSLTDSYHQLAIEMIGELRAPDKSAFSYLGMFTARGERDKTTTELYTALTKRITEGLAVLKEFTDILAAREYSQPDREMMMR